MSTFAVGDRVTMNPDCDDFEKYIDQHNDSAGTIVERVDVGDDKSWVLWDCSPNGNVFFYHDDSLLLLPYDHHIIPPSPFDLFDDELEYFETEYSTTNTVLSNFNIGDYVIYNPKSRTFKELFSQHNGDKGVVIEILDSNVTIKIQWLSGFVGLYNNVDLILSQYDEITPIVETTPLPKKREKPDRHIFLPGDIVKLKESSMGNRDRIAKNGSSVFYVIDSNFNEIRKSDIDRLSQSDYDTTTCKLMYQNENLHFNVNYADIEFLSYNNDDIIKVGPNYYAIMTKSESMRKLDEYFITNLKKVSNSIIFDENYRNNILNR